MCNEEVEPLVNLTQAVSIKTSFADFRERAERDNVLDMTAGELKGKLAVSQSDVRPDWRCEGGERWRRVKRDDDWDI